MFEVIGTAAFAYTFTTTAFGSLDHHGKANLAGELVLKESIADSSSLSRRLNYAYLDTFLGIGDTRLLINIHWYIDGFTIAFIPCKFQI